MCVCFAAQIHSFDVDDKFDSKKDAPDIDARNKEPQSPGLAGRKLSGLPGSV